MITSSVLPLYNALANTNLCQKKIIKPARLHRGDTIGLVAPGSPLTKKKFRTCIDNLTALGFQLKYDEATVMAQNGYLAGSDTLRLQSLHAMFADSTVKAIWCLRGGYGTSRLLPDLDFGLVKKNPKVLIGYSDITALNNVIFQQTGLVTFHGPMGVSDFTAYTTQQLLAVLMQSNEALSIPLSSENQALINGKTQPAFFRQTITGGKAIGQLCGGNLSLLVALVGTSYEPDFTNKIIFIEEIGEKPYRIDRMFTQLLQTKTFRKASGIALGIFEDCQPPSDEPSLSLLATLQDRLSGLSIPVAYGFSFGHIANMCTLPIGISATLDADTFSLTLNESAVL
ncbi:MAG: LD-carboxypeptidase [Saprospiraceae bacterium]